MLSRTGRKALLMNTRFALLLSAAASVVAACGDSQEADTRGALITWSEGDLDFFGCPYRIPEPWTASEADRGKCGDRCRGTAVARGSTGPDLVACISPDMEFHDYAPDGTICMTHPVTRREYIFSNLGWEPMRQICWAPCEGETWVAAPPDECFESLEP